MIGSAIVVGAGITGLSAAEWLRRAGVDVTLIDRVMPDDAAQASYGNGGILARCAIVPVSVPGLLAKAPKMLLDRDSPLFLRWSYLPRLLPWLIPFLHNGSGGRMRAIVKALEPLTTDSVDQHMALSAGTGAERYVATGEYAYLYPDRAAFEGDALAMGLRDAYGFGFEERGRQALADADPELGEAYNFAAVFKDHGWITDPGAYLAALAGHFRKQGGTFRQAEAAEIGNGTVTLADGDSLSADKVVLAAGVWSKALAEKIGHRASMESERGYHLDLQQPSHSPPIPYMVADAKVVVTPMTGALRCAGVVEFGGLEAPPSKGPINLIRRQIRRVYPRLTWQGEAEWMGHRPSTADSLPLLGHAPKAPRVVFAFGSHHIGMTIGPRLGRMAGDIALERLGNTDISPYAADRFDKNGRGGVPQVSVGVG